MDDYIYFQETIVIIFDISAAYILNSFSCNSDIMILVLFVENSHNYLTHEDFYSKMVENKL